MGSKHGISSSSREGTWCWGLGEGSSIEAGLDCSNHHPPKATPLYQQQSRRCVLFHLIGHPHDPAPNPMPPRKPQDSGTLTNHDA